MQVFQYLALGNALGPVLEISILEQLIHNEEQAYRGCILDAVPLL